MVFLHFPSSYTEEESMLQTKFEKLKRKKKALHNLKAPKSEPERVTPIKKPQIEARDAREIAKKLIRSGAIAAIQKTPKRDEQAGFKRPSGLERKLEKTISGYQPFSVTQSEECAPTFTEVEKPKKKLYNNFVAAKERDERPERREALPPPTRETPKQGNTIFVTGHKITEEFLRKTFSVCGTIVNINMELEKSRGFVTFEKMESAETAITEYDGSCVSDVNLKVSYARRQPPVAPVAEATIWASGAPPQKKAAKDAREKVYYGDVCITY